MKTNSRMVRVNELIRREIANTIQNKIERTEGCLVSVTEVDTAPDLRNAKVSISVLGAQEVKNNIMRKLQKNRSYIQSVIATNIKLKFTPVLSFVLDNKVESGDKVLALLNDLKTETD